MNDYARNITGHKGNLGSDTIAPTDGDMKKILVIDDSPELLQLIAMALSRHGYAVDTAPDGAAGMDAVARNPPDLILCDVYMPRMDGFATLAAIQRNPLCSTTPFIFLTGQSDREKIRRAMELGADDLLIKPFTIEELLRAVQTRLEKNALFKKQSEARLEQLRGNISMALPHELRTPLNGIIGLSSLMMEETDSFTPEAVRENTRYIYESALRLNGLIENFLIYTQVEMLASDPQQVMALYPTDPQPISETMSAIAASKAAKFHRQADLLADISPVNTRMPGEHVRKILEELVDNGFKFSPKDTAVWVVAHPLAHGFELSVMNQGRGMTAEQITQIGPHMQFERNKYEQQGSGLGLITAKKLAELHGGTLQIESSPGQTTTVRVHVPL